MTGTLTVTDTSDAGITLAGITTITDITVASAVDTASLIAMGGAWINENVHVKSATSSTNTITGALVVVGGAGVGENMYIGGTLDVDAVTTAAGTDMDIRSGGDLTLAAAADGVITVEQDTADRLVIDTEGAILVDSAASKTIDVKQGGEARFAVNTAGQVTVSSDTAQDVVVTSGKDVLITRCVWKGWAGMGWEEGCSGVGRRGLAEVNVVSTCRAREARQHRAEGTGAQAGLRRC